MTTGIGIHIGLNRVDPKCYGGWNGALSGCVNDANAMNAISQSLGYRTTVLLDNAATGDGVIRAIRAAAEALLPGDYLVVTYSGHGGQIPDIDSDEPDKKDETWVLFDRQLIDDELDSLWSQFHNDVHIFVLSDSCHSGTVTRARIGEALIRRIPLDVQESNYLDNKAAYSAIKRAARAPKEPRASILLISGCQDNQTSADGQSHGLFTATLLEVWNGGKFRGNYRDFCAAIKDSMPSTQQPNYFWVGAADPGFEASRPFELVRAPGGTFQCTVAAVGPHANGKVYISLVEAESGAFSDWYVVDEASKKEMLATALAAITNRLKVLAEISTTSAYGTVTRMYVNRFD